MTDMKIEVKILEEINLTHQSLDEGVQHLIEWTQKQPHLPTVADESLLKAFIVGSKSVERAKERLDKYFSAKTKYPECFRDREPKLLRWEKNLGSILLPGLTPDGCNILFSAIPLQKEAINKFDYIETCKSIFMGIECSFRSNPIMAGQFVVIDCKGMTLDFVTKCLSSFTLGSFDTYQNALPLRIKGLICFNSSSVAEVFSNQVLKAFLSPKLKERVFVHSDDHTILSKYFPLDLLPKEYGGSAPPIKDILENLKKDLERNRDWFLNEGNEGSDELKRPKSDKNPEQLQGTFRKLQLD